MYTVSIAELINQYDLKLLNKCVDCSKIYLSHAEINRPALQLAGFYDYFDADRLQIIGKVEYAYLERMTPEFRQATLKRLFEYKTPCVVMSRGLEPFPEMMFYAASNGVPLLQTQDSTTDFLGEVIRWLKVQLAPRITMHGVLVDIYGEGVLITGESGIGKSETALELIKRGHRLVADDSVEIKKVSAQTLIGSCPEIIRFFIELRGIGIIDVRQMFGVEAVKAIQNIDLVIKLETWENGREYDRLGLTDEYIDILGNSVICHSIPVRTGRNLSIICESVAINHRQKKMGYNAAKVLQDRVLENINKSKNKEF